MNALFENYLGNFEDGVWNAYLGVARIEKISLKIMDIGAWLGCMIMAWRMPIRPYEGIIRCGKNAEIVCILAPLACGLRCGIQNLSLLLIMTHDLLCVV